ncbi:MAG: putative dsRNA-binding protein, partial [Candidatus Omnitrophota bacterium]|jgi:ribonuclease-3
MRIARTIRFQRFVKVSRGLRKDKNYLQAKVFVDALEALIAAYYFDRGLASAEKLILSLYDGYFDSRKLLRIDPNPKSSLQELAQKNWQVLPLYLHKNTPNGVECTVSVGTALKASAQCKTRREAEEKAAGLLTKKLRQDLVRRSKKSSSGRKLPKTSREPSRKS